MSWDLLPYLLAIIGIGSLLLLARQMFRSARPPYEQRPSLLTKTELVFYHSLLEAVGDQWLIAPMVRMADLIKVKSGAPKRQAWLNRILAKHIDFVLCEHGTLCLTLAIELDDRSHERPDRIERDQFVDAALRAAALPILRIQVESEYDANDLRKKIRDKIARS